MPEKSHWMILHRSVPRPLTRSWSHTFSESIPKSTVRTRASREGGRTGMGRDDRSTRAQHRTGVAEYVQFVPFLDSK
eukprot:1992080-Rhodomonas_salina.1